MGGVFCNFNFFVIFYGRKKKRSIHLRKCSRLSLSQAAQSAMFIQSWCWRYTSKKTWNSRLLSSYLFAHQPNITARQGYKVRQYEVKTEDGYILFVIRISTTVEANHGIVFLQHPYTADSVVWVDKGKNKSLGFILADQGYDVWLGNSRATRLSLGHINLTTKDAKYWGYRFEQTKP